MKNRLSLLFLLLFFSFLKAQVPCRAWSLGFDNKITTMVQGAQGTWFLGGSHGFPQMVFSDAYCCEISAEGDLLRERVFHFAEQAEVTAMVPLPDGRCIVGGNTRGCDVGFSGFLLLLNPNNLTQWIKVKNVNTLEGHFPYILSLALSSDGKTVMALGEEDGETKVQRYDIETGNLLSEVILPQRFQVITPELGAADFLLAGDDGVWRLKDGALQQLLSQTGPFLQVLAGPQGDYYCLLPYGNLLRCNWNNGSGLIKEIYLGFNASDMRLIGSDIAVCGDGKVVLLDAALNKISSFLLPEGFTATHIGPYGAQACLLAGQEHHQTSHNYWMQAFTWDGTPLQQGTDAALSDLTALTEPVATYNPIGAVPLWEVSGGTFSVRLHNKGSVPLESVTIASSGFGALIPIFCPTDGYYLRVFTDLYLAPGADTVLLLDVITAPYVSFIHPWSFCVWTVAPNHLPDIKGSNNSTCASFDITIAVGDPAAPGVLPIFPNPATDEIFVQMPAGMEASNCLIFNLEGRLMAEFATSGYPASGGRSLNIAQLPPGLYFLQTGGVWGKFIKAR